MKQAEGDRYGDIIGLPHHRSKKRPHMPVQERAAQFSPFAALTGYESAESEAARLTEDMAELSEDQKEMLDEQFGRIRERLKEHPQVTVIYFEPDKKKAGGRYVEKSGRIRRIGGCGERMIFEDGTEVELSRITDIRSWDFMAEFSDSS